MPQNLPGEMYIRGNYHRDRNTRVINPSVDVSRAAGRVRVGADYTLDAITSASLAAGVTADQPFTELRHEAGLRASVQLSRAATLTGNYSYSTESDYWSHGAGLRLNLSLFQDNTSLLFGADYGYNIAAKRLGPTGYLLQGTLQTVHLVAAWSQVLGRGLLGTVSWETTVSSGFHNNPYRPVFVGGERREIEHLPTRKVQNVAALSAHGMVRLGSDVVPHLTFRPAVRVFFNTWGMAAGSPELATYLPVGPVEARLLVSYYRQKAASFYRAEGQSRRTYVEGTPSYDGGAVPFEGDQVYTSDVKLSSFSDWVLELMLRWRLTSLARAAHLGGFLERTMIEVTGGLVLPDAAVAWQFGIPFAADDPQAPAGCSLRCGWYYLNLGLAFPL